MKLLWSEDRDDVLDVYIQNVGCGEKEMMVLDGVVTDLLLYVFVVYVQ